MKDRHKNENHTGDQGSMHEWWLHDQVFRDLSDQHFMPEEGINEAEQRTLEQWQQQWMTHIRHTHRALLLVGAVTLLAIASGAWTFVLAHRSDRSLVRDLSDHHPLPHNQQLPSEHDTVTAPQTTHDNPSSVAQIPNNGSRVILPSNAQTPHSRRGIAPTDAELSLFLAARSRSPQVAIQTDPLVNALRTLVEAPETDDACVAYHLTYQNRTPDLAGRILRRAQRETGQSKMAAIRLLGALRCQQAIPWLLITRDDPAIGPFAMEALKRIGNANVYAQLARTASQPEVRHAAVDYLVMQPDAASLDAIVQLYSIRDVRLMILDCVTRHTELPTTEWLARLGSTSAADRIVAASILARVDRPDVVFQVIRRTQQEMTADAALLCLLSHTSRDAQTYVRMVSRDVNALRRINHVRLQAQLTFIN